MSDRNNVIHCIIILTEGLTIKGEEVALIKDKWRTTKGKIRLSPWYTDHIQKKLLKLIPQCKPSMKSYHMNKISGLPYLKMYATCKPHLHCNYLLVLRNKRARSAAPRCLFSIGYRGSLLDAYAPTRQSNTFFGHCFLQQLFVALHLILFSILWILWIWIRTSGAVLMPNRLKSGGQPMVIIVGPE